MRRLRIADGCLLLRLLAALLWTTPRFLLPSPPAPDDGRGVFPHPSTEVAAPPGTRVGEGLGGWAESCCASVPDQSAAVGTRSRSEPSNVWPIPSSIALPATFGARLAGPPTTGRRSAVRRPMALVETLGALVHQGSVSGKSDACAEHAMALLKCGAEADSFPV